MKKFSGKKDLLAHLTLLIFPVSLTVYLFWLFLNANNFWTAFIAILVVIFCNGLLLWIYWGTYYRVENEDLRYFSGPFRGRIPIHQITKVQKNKTLWVGLKMATSINGIVVYYNKYDEIYLSPKNVDAFLKTLQKINPNIQVL